MSIVSEEPVMDDSFHRLLNEFAPMHSVLLGRSRTVLIQKALKQRRMSSADVGHFRRTKYATILANIPRKQMSSPNNTSEHKNRILLGQIVVSEDKKLIPGLFGILNADTLSELFEEKMTLKLMKTAITNEEYEGLARIDHYIKTFWISAAVVDDCIFIEDRIAICLQREMLTRLHRSHPGQKRWSIQPSICGDREFIGTSCIYARNVKNAPILIRT